MVTLEEIEGCEVNYNLPNLGLAPWCLRGKGGMDPYGSPYIIPDNDPYNPVPLSLLGTREV